MHYFQPQKSHNKGNVIEHHHSIVGKGTDLGTSCLSWKPNSSAHYLCSCEQVTYPPHVLIFSSAN